MIVMGVAIGALTMWNVVLTFLACTAILVGKKNDDDIEAIKSWYPFCEIMKMRIPKGGDDE